MGRGVSTTHTPLGRHLPGRHPLPSVCWDTHTPCPVHAGIHTPLHSACWDTVNKRLVCILLECILVYASFGKTFAKQECIPVGCIPSATVAICWGCTWSGGYLVQGVYLVPEGVPGLRGVYLVWGIPAQVTPPWTGRQV